MGKIQLGEKVACRVTGFEGIATARCEYSHGEPTVQVSPALDSAGLYREPQWFPEDRLLSINAATPI